jgi:hypothetical protein
MSLNKRKHSENYGEVAKKRITKDDPNHNNKFIAIFDMCSKFDFLDFLENEQFSNHSKDVFNFRLV